ncbi:MAG TPA: PDZ domain-containing protein [Candidatus Polarisedimenticolaceae bacterium]|nr:PDZ domain-containing protein [Candidatus Polarisedimenticolaceae bacterium]
MRAGIGPFITLGALLLSPAADAAIDARMLRFPDVSREQIAFVYAGDIWIVGKSGGVAHRLSTPAGQETFPRFSPDGRSIAFSGNYDGNTDLYVVPASGGIPLRLTHHPSNDRMLDWYPDGESILFASSMASGTNRFNQLYRTSRTGGLPERLPVPYGEFGSVAPDGRRLAYLPLTRDFRTWKRYRGGSTSDIWLFDLERRTADNLTDSRSNDTQPMWHGETLYFLSDRDANKRYNIWAIDGAGGSPRQVTRFDTMDVAFPAIGPAEIVFSVGSELYLLDLDSERYAAVDVEVVTDRATLKPRHTEVHEQITSGDISPTGKRAVFEARGEIFTVPAEHGVTRNLTRSSGVAERHPAWSPDGEWVAYHSDRSGEYELTIAAADGSGDERRLTTLGPGYRYDLHWSPDSKKLVFIDQTMTIRLYDLDKETTTALDKGRYLYHGGLSGFVARWSADSRWVAWARSVDTRNRAIFVYDAREGELHQATSGFYDEQEPVFDPEGKQLYFLSSRTFEPAYSDIDNSWIYANTANVVAVPLRDDVASPIAPRNDDEGQDESDDDAKKDKKKDKKQEKDDEQDEKKPPQPVEIDFDGFERRLVVLPVDPGNFATLEAVPGKVVYHRRPRTGADEEAPSPIVYYDLEEREEKTILEDADDFAISADDEKMLVVHEEKFAIVDVAAEQKMDETLDLSGLELELDPVAEWRQIFHDAWRFERDYFYDPRMHGVDWDDMRERYAALLDDVVTRWDLNFLIGELIAELNASHAYRGGGDEQQPKELGTGLLGCDFELVDGAYRIARIVDGAVWDSEVRSPLARPGIEIDEGDYLLAVNGRPIDTTKDPWASFQGLADATVELTVNDRPTTEGARQVLVHTLDSEFRLRNLDWIETNRRKVDAATGGRVGYVYVPDTGINGQNELVRMFKGQYAKDGLIIDERFNSGGQIPDRFIELLNRPLYNYWGVRDGKDWQWPPVAHRGPKAMLVNPWSGSGGDLFPYYFKQAGLGPLVGMTTWGGLIGISGSPALIDGGVVTVPTFGIYSLDGRWIIENEGVEPDIEVVDDPSKMVDGGDPQLERAIAEVMERLRDAPVTEPGKPPYPDRSGR